MQALAAASTALSINNAANAVTAGQAVKDANIADQAGGISLNVSVGTSSAKSNSQVSQSVAHASTLKAGGDINITGSQVQAGQDIALDATRNINLQAAQNTRSLQSSNKSNSASVGVSFSLGAQGGITPNASFNTSRGNANGSDTSCTEWC